jgi:hypothetical protein
LEDLVSDGSILHQEYDNYEGGSGVNYWRMNVLFWLEIQANQVFVDVVVCGIKQ